MWNLPRLAIKFFKRELLNGEFSLLILSLVIAASSLSSIGFLIEHINGSMNQHAGQLYGAQLVLKSSSEIPESWQKKAQHLQLKQARMVAFPSMLAVNDEFKLAQIKAVSSNFPLQGELQIKKHDRIQTASAPLPGEIWLDKRLAAFFKLSLTAQLASGDQSLLELGDAQFNASALLVRVPGQSNSLFRIAPTAMINLADLDKTATIQPGSRVDYLYFFSSKSITEQQSLASYRQWLKAKLTAGQSLRSGVEDYKAVKTSLKKASDYLSLAGVLTLLLSAIAIAISCHRYGQIQYKNNAIMLCLGFSEKKIILIEFIKLLILGMAGNVMGILLGYLVYLALLSVLAELLNSADSHFFLTPVLVSLISGMFLLLTISMVNLVRIKKLSPMGLIRNELLSSSSIAELMNNKLFYVISFAGLVFISVWYSGNTQLTLVFYLALFLSALLFYFFAKLLLLLIIRYGRRLQLINRLSLLNLERHQQAVLLQVSSFSLIFSLTIIIFLVRTELLDDWQNNFPEGTPNHFVINVQSHERESFKSYLDQHKIKTQGLYPMIRGRLTHINHLAVNQALPKKAQSHNALHRALNLSVSDSWMSADMLTELPSESALISIEKGLAGALNLQLGDLLTFNIGSQSIGARIAQIRTVKWDSFQPNFYIIFSPGSIEKYPMTWIASFYLAQDDKIQLNHLRSQFSGITIIEVDEVLKEIQFIINKVSASIEVILVFIVIAGMLILTASLSSTMAARMYENAIIRTLGASIGQLRRCLLVEFIVVALLSVLIAVLLAELTAYMLYQQVFQIPFSVHPGVWLVMLVSSLLLICGLGMLLVNKVFTQSAHQSLNHSSR